MRLYYSPTSPYVRKVTMTAIETGLDGQIERIPAFPAGPDTIVAEANPMGKVPALVRNDGSTLFDSPVICEYLDSLHNGDKLIPESGEDRIQVLRLQALADGAMDATVLQVFEARRPENERSAGWVTRQQQAVSQAMDEMEKCVDSLGDRLTLAHISFCCALGIVDLRKPDWDWRDSRPALADWYADFSARASAMATEPKDPT